VIKSNFFSRKARIEMLPLIDVIFLLLAVFIISTRMYDVKRELNVELPSVSEAAFSEEKLPTISILSDGALMLDGRSVEQEALKNHPVLRKSAQDGKGVAVEGDKSVPLQTLVEVLSFVRESGVHSVHFGVRDNEG